MSDDIIGRRSVVKKTGAVVAGVGLCMSGSATASETDTVSESDDSSPEPADAKNHYVKFEIEKGDGSPDYEVNVPDPDPRLVNIDNGVGGINNDKVIKHDTWTKIKGGLDGANEPFYDEIEFNGSLDDSDWEIVNADPEIRVTVDGTVKQEG